MRILPRECTVKYTPRLILNLSISYFIIIYCIRIRTRRGGYTVKYNPLPEEVPESEAEGTPEGNGLYLTVYPETSPNTDII